MPPQEQQNTPPQPVSPDPQYDFIYKNQQQGPKKKFGLPSFALNMRPAFLVLFGLIGVIFLVVLYSLFFGGKGGNTQELVNIMARGQEIARVSSYVVQQSPDAESQELAMTTSSSLASDQSQLLAYLKTQREKVSRKSLAAFLNKQTDAKLVSAAQTNSLSEFYYAYLKDQLGRYQSSLKTAFANTPQKGKPILQDAYASAGTILSSPQVSSVSSD